jgi:hypothetical protein
VKAASAAVPASGVARSDRTDRSKAANRIVTYWNQQAPAVKPAAHS